MATTKKAAASTALTNDEGLLTMSNVQALNTVRAYAPADYQNRIPVATQGNLVSVLESMNAYMPNWDVFWNVFVGRIGRVQINNRMGFVNPYRSLWKPAMRYGRTIQEIQANLVRARSYDAKAENVFGRDGRTPQIEQCFHQESRRDKYEINIPMDDVLRGSFIEGESISALFNSLTESPIESATNDEYLLNNKLFSEYDRIHGFWNIHVPAITRDMSKEDLEIAGAKLVSAMRATYNKRNFYTSATDWSVYGRERGLATRAPRMIAIIDADVEAALKVTTQAYAFNESNQKIIADEIIVVDKLPIAGCQAIMIDDEFLQCADTLGPIMLQSPLNPDNMSYNYFYHVWQVLSYSLMLGAVMFSTRADSELTVGTSTVEGVELKDASGATEGAVELGGEVALYATVTGTNSPNQAVAYTIKAYNGKGRGMALPTDVYVDSNGVLHVGTASALAKITVMATSVQDNTHSAIYTATVAGSDYVTAVAGNATSVKAGEQATVAVTFTPASATDMSYSVESSDTSIMQVVAATTSGFTVEGLKAGTANALIVARGGDPAKDQVTATVKITVTA